MSQFFEQFFERNGSLRSGSPQRAINPISSYQFKQAHLKGGVIGYLSSLLPELMFCMLLDIKHFKERGFSVYCAL